MSNHPVLLPLSAAGLGLSALFSIPAIAAVLNQIRRGAPRDNFYEDRDGKSTPEAVAKFSNRTPKTVIRLFSSLGLATSTSISVLTTLDSTRYGLFLENWLVTASWVRFYAPVGRFGCADSSHWWCIGLHPPPDNSSGRSPCTCPSLQYWALDFCFFRCDSCRPCPPSFRCGQPLG